MLNKITTIDSTINYFQYGGIINQIENSTMILKYSVSIVYIQVDTYQIVASGQIIGVSKHNSSYFSFDNLCLTDLTQYQCIQVDSAGVIGILDGSLSIINSHIKIQVSGNSKFSNFGSIGIVSKICRSVHFNNIILQFNSTQKTIYDLSEINVAALIGQTNSKNIDLYNIQFIQCDIVASSNIAFVSGYLQNAQINCNKISITDSLLQSKAESSLAAGIISLSLNCSFIIIYVQINQTIVNSSCHSSGILSQSSNDQGQIENFKLINTLIFSRSQQISFAAANIAQTDCSEFKIKNYLLQNSQIIVQSKNQGIASGYVAFSNNSNVQINTCLLTQSNITSNSRFPISSALAGTFINGSNNIYNVEFVNIIQLSLDELYRNESGKQYGFSGASFINSTINIANLNIQNLISQVQCQLFVSASAIISYSQNSVIYINNIILSNSTIIAISSNTIIEVSVIASGLIGLDNYLQIDDANNCISNININNIKIENTTIQSVSEFKEAYVSGIQAVSFNSQNRVSNVNIINTNMSCSGQKYLRIGGIYAAASYAFSRLNDIKISNSNFNAISKQESTNSYDILYGGIVGVLWVYSNMELLSSTIKNVNFTNTGMIGLVQAATIIGQSQGNVTLSDLQLKNNIIKTSGTIIYTSAIIGQFIPYSATNNINSLIILNSNIQSITMLTQNSSIQYIQFIAFISSFLDTQITIQNSNSLGFSSVNGIRINNCESLQVINVNGQLPFCGC
ncbi:Hypothetical_protein [Hexamita inflata]|uniref:Hypothetical_protein n=1 Tax=Hexamita inflata TaxID=28002 RepID=A0AA86Q5C7_9EUKA|nr:Hypothetical protein HINF_LOCUS38471 [Hexamita inflata]